MAILLCAEKHRLAAEFFIPLSPFPCQYENGKGIGAGEYCSKRGGSLTLKSRKITRMLGFAELILDSSHSAFSLPAT